MTYKVLYRKYRPDVFENIVGQDYIIKTLRNSIINNNISHAYIFSGPRGTGKTSTAKVFSKAINCLNPIDGTPCGKCEFCQNFHENPDIIEIDAASNNGVDEIRNLIDNIKLAPTNGKYKVYIIDEVHMLTTSAFNALLLTLEEPPSHTIFILATTNIESVPITILSRCQRFDFQKIDIEDLVLRLKVICENEQIDIEDNALKEIAYLSDGGMRDALSLLDQLSKSKEKITLEFIDKQFKTVSKKNVMDLLDTIEDNDYEKCIELINDYRIRAVDYKTLVKKIIEVASERAKTIKINGRIKKLDYSNYKNIILELAKSLSIINVNVDSFTILEMILLDYFADVKRPITEEIKVEEKEIPVTEKIEENVEQPTNPELIKIRINNCFANAQKSYLEAVKKKIESYKQSVNLDGKIKSIIIDSNIVAASDKNLILTCSNAHNVQKANKMLEEIEKSLKNEMDEDYKIVFLTIEEWGLEKEKYIKNLKNNIKYEYIEEKEEVDNNPPINDVFDISKVEII